MVVVAYGKDAIGYEPQYELEITDVKKISSEASSFGLIYDGQNLDNIIQSISVIKQSLDPYIYCKPLILLSDIQSSNLPEQLSESVDAVVPVKSFHQSPKTKSIIDAINKKISALIVHEESKDTNIILRVLRYAFCKNIKLFPSKNIHNKNGYSYYAISHLFEDENSLHASIFKSMESKSLLESTYVDKAHSCPECSSVFINFKEVCPSCLSSNIYSEDLIHHYVCANLSPESTYKKSASGLSCPKCMENLKRIGVDFDKPSIMYKCKKCEKDFQEPDVVGECFNCNSKFPSELLDIIEFKEYELSAIGENAAIYGLGNLIEEMLDSEQNVVDFRVFKKFIAIERSRIERYKLSDSSFAILKIAQGDQLLLQLKNFDTLKEIAKEIKLMLRTTDVLTSFSDLTFGILMMETDIQGSTLALNRLVENINTLLKSNVENISKDSVYKLVSVSKMSIEDVENIWKELDV